METLTIGGKPRAFRFSTYAIKAYCDLRNMSLKDFYIEVQKIVKNEIDVDTLGDIMYAGLVGGALRSHETLDFTRENVSDWMDDKGITSLPEVITAFSDSLVGKKKEVVVPKVRAKK